MTNNERKYAKPSLIPLEIDPASILSLSKGVIFDTIVHNIEYTLGKRRTDPLPWKLIGMSLICDPSRNKKYMQKLQKMQCVRSVICTQIYHSKLIKTDAGQLTTPGRKIILPTVPNKRLSGIFVCRSIDELLYMESSSSENVHFIQYKLLSYERIATRELVNGPKLSTVGEKIIKTVFDFELSQHFDFPRQLLPVAIISFAREQGTDLCLSIRNFVNQEEHKTFDKSYLVTSINVEVDRLREEDERKQDAEAEQAILWEKAQRRPPLADLSRQSTDSGNTRPIPAPPSRLPPIKVKIPCPEKPSIPNLSIDSKFHCSLKLDRIDLSEYQISNLSEIKVNKSKGPPISADPITTKPKPLTITKPYEHQKPLKRLNNQQTKKSVSVSSLEVSRVKSTNEIVPQRQSTGTLKITIPTNVTKGRSSTSSSSMSPIYRASLTITKKTDKPAVKKKVKRPVLPADYHCSLQLSRLDLSQYDLDLPPPPTSVPTSTIEIESSETSSSSNVTPPDQSMEPLKITMKLKSIDESKPETETSSEKNPPKRLLNIVEGFSTPDLNEEDDNTSEVVPTPMDDNDDEPILNLSNESLPTLTNEIVSQAINDLVTSISTNIEPAVPDEKDQTSVPTPTVTPSPAESEPTCTETPSTVKPDNSNLHSEDYIIIVPCSSDEEDDDLDDDDDISIHHFKNSIINKKSDTKTAPSASSSSSSSSSSPPINLTSPLRNPSLTRVLTNTDRLKSNRLSTSSLSSCCSSLSGSILHVHSPQTPLHLTTIVLPEKIQKKKKQCPSSFTNFTRYDINIPNLAQESLIDPRLIYRLQTITTDLRWPSLCTQCSISPYTPPPFSSSTQTILFDRNSPADFVDPRRESLKNAILNSIYHRMRVLIPNMPVIDSTRFHKVLFEQTTFQTNCSLHLEYLLHKLKQTEDATFFQMIQTTEEFRLSPYLLQLIFN